MPIWFLLQKVSWEGPTLKHGCIWYHSHGGDANSVPIRGGEGMSDANLVPIGQKVSWQGPTLKHGCIWYQSHGRDAESVPIGGGGGGHVGRQSGSYWTKGKLAGCMGRFDISGVEGMQTLCRFVGARVFRTPIWFLLDTREVGRVAGCMAGWHPRH